MICSAFRRQEGQDPNGSRSGLPGPGRAGAVGGDPAFGLFFPGGGLAGQGGVLAGAQSVDDDRQVALPEFGSAVGIAQLDFGEKLEQEANVEEGDVVPEQAGSADPLEKLVTQ